MVNHFTRFGLTCIIAALFIFLPIDGSSQTEGGLKCLVLDAGHGGRDSGCLSKDKKYSEKNIVLSVVLKLGKIIEDEHPDVKVVYTRKKDVFIPLAERADIANRNKADLFISVHVNANPSPVPRGAETFTMGTHVSDRNFEVSKRENAVIKMEEDYSTKYEGFNPDSPESYIIFSLLQNAYSEQSIKFAKFIQDEYAKGPVRHGRGVKQAGFLVLWRTTMPSVLTEIGFLTNPNDLKVLITDEGQSKIARRLADAFTKYKEDYERRNSLDSRPAEPNNEPEDIEQMPKVKEQEVKPKQEPEVKPKEPEQKDKIEQLDTFYSIQIMAVNKKLASNSPDLKGRKDARFIYQDGRYKYFLGNYKTREAAAKDLPKIRKVFKGAFVIVVREGVIYSK